MSWNPETALTLSRLRAAYLGGEIDPVSVIREVYARWRRRDDPGIFIHLVSEVDAVRAAERLVEHGDRSLPLFGVPFAVKDNIDVAGLPTTAGCPAFEYLAERSAPAVEKLLAAGAILIGKTNLDQFATGLVGVRSPYPPPKNPFDPGLIPGGSSSGSAVAVATGLSSFALGTDTAGSGRVPAAMNNLVGAKPTRGMVSTRGVVPACRAQDTVSVFALTVEDAALVLETMRGLDPEDPYSRVVADGWSPRPRPIGREFRFGVLEPKHLKFADPATRTAYERALEVMQELGGVAELIDYTPFERAAASLYGGPWLVQRLEAAGELLEKDPAALYPVTRQVLQGARRHAALAVYRAEAERVADARAADMVMQKLDFLLLPTIPGPCSVDAVTRDPIGENTRLGTYTNFVNLLDLSALAVPVGIGEDGAPRGVTLIGKAFEDGVLAGYGAALHARTNQRLGIFAEAPREPDPAPLVSPFKLIVAGAHMSGGPLNHELVSLGAHLLRSSRTRAAYRLYALDTTPPKPGLVRVGKDEPGFEIECEEWSMSAEALGTFASRLPAPMCLGSVELCDGSRALGFLCEPYAVTGAVEISEHRSWRQYQKQRRAPKS